MADIEPERDKVVFTVGHSNHPIGHLCEILKSHGITVVADVRRFPSSTRWPQFNRKALEQSFKEVGISYCWIPALGGRRSLTGESRVYAGWRTAGFRAYAAYMASEQFAQGLSDLLSLVASQTVAAMCSEGLWWRCHRRLIADRLVTMGHSVFHILPDGKAVVHQPTSFLCVVDGMLLYPDKSLAAGESIKQEGQDKAS